MKFTRGNAAGHTAPTPSGRLSVSGTASFGGSNLSPTLSVSGIGGHSPTLSVPETGGSNPSRTPPPTPSATLSLSGTAYLPPPLARLLHRLGRALSAVGAQFLVACITASFFLAAICGAFNSKKKEKPV